MALDPNDPLIPLPWQMENIRAYRAQKGAEAEMDRMRAEKLRLDLEEARAKTLPGRVADAEKLAMIQERSRQIGKFIPIGPEIGATVTRKGGPSLLEATEMQKDLEVERRAEQARLGAAEQYGIERGLTPTAKIDSGGVSATVPFEAAGQRMASMQQNVYNTVVPMMTQTFIDSGYDPATANKMAIERVRDSLVKATQDGKVTLMGLDGGTVAIGYEKAMQMWRDPKTPKAMKVQLDSFFGPSETPKASNWVNTRLGR
jgi:hypothetical protein